MVADMFSVNNTKVTEFTYYKHHLFMINCFVNFSQDVEFSQNCSIV